MSNRILVAAVGLIDPDGRVLMTTRPKGKDYAGLWEFPGGKVEDGEYPGDAAVRELEEELGVSTEHHCLAPFGFGVERDAGLLLLLFLCRKWDGRPHGREGQSVRWTAPAELLTLDMPPVDRPLAAQLRDYLLGV